MDPIMLADIWAWLRAFFTEPLPLFGLGLARCTIGLMVLIDGIRHLGDAPVWLEPRALGHRRELAAEGGPWSRRWAALVALSWKPRVYVPIHCGLAGLLCLGLGGSVTPMLVFLTLRRIHQANRFVLYGGDAVMRMAVLVMVVSPCTASLSLDCWLTTGDLGLWIQGPPWGMRLLQFELAVLYFYNCWYKIRYAAWRDGTAVYYPLNNTDIRNLRLPIPKFALGRILVAIGTWGTLVLEFALGPGLWIEELRIPLVIGAIVLHLAIAYAFSLWLFSYIMISCLCVFIEPGWLFSPSSEVVSVIAWGPHTGLGLSLGLGLGCLYVVFAVFWDPPQEGSLMSRGIRRHFGKTLRRVGIVRRWRLFSGNPPASRTVTLILTMTDAEGEVSKWGWNQTIGLFSEDPLLDKRTVWNHRLRKYASSLLRVPEAQQRFGEYMVEIAETKGIEVEALTIDVRFEYIGNMQTGEPLEAEAHRNLYTYVAPEGEDDSMAALACSLAERSGSPLVVEVLVYLAAQALSAGRSDDEFLALIERFARSSEWESVPKEDLYGTHAHVRQVVLDEDRRTHYFDILDALSGERSWDEVFGDTVEQEGLDR